MDYCRNFEQNAFLVSHEETRGFISVLDRKDFIICPRPRRAGLSSPSSLRPMRCHMSHATESYNSTAGVELLDLILAKEDSALVHHASAIVPSPPFFSGSPPSRASNPLIQDSRFREEGINPITAFPGASPSGLPPSLLSAHTECVRRPVGARPATAAAVAVEGFDILDGDRANTGLRAAIRVEGFDILSRDRRNSSISAAA